MLEKRGITKHGIDPKIIEVEIYINFRVLQLIPILYLHIHVHTELVNINSVL